MNKEYPFKIVLLGNIASGKLTQGSILANKWNLVLITLESAVEFFLTNSLSPIIVKEISEIKNSERDFTDDIINTVLSFRINQQDVEKNGFVLLDYPKNPKQVELFKKEKIEFDVVIYLNIPKNIVIERISGCIVNVLTKRRYHVSDNPPPTEIPKVTKTKTLYEPLYKDINKTEIHNKFDEYQKRSTKALDFFDDVFIIDGYRKIEKVTAEIYEVIQELFEDKKKFDEGRWDNLPILKIAGGVAVGILVATAGLGALFWMKNRKKK